MTDAAELDDMMALWSRTHREIPAIVPSFNAKSKVLRECMAQMWTELHDDWTAKQDTKSLSEIANRYLSVFEKDGEQVMAVIRWFTVIHDTNGLNEIVGVFEEFRNKINEHFSTEENKLVENETEIPF